MRKTAQVFVALLFISTLSFAQGKNNKLNMRMVIESPDTQSVILNYLGSTKNAIEGYYLQQRYKDIYIPTAALQKGGFSFLNAYVFGGFVESLSKKWIKNNFPITDIASLTNGLEPAKVISFQIKPIIVDGKSDTLHLLVKYALIDFWDNRESALKFTPHVQLFYQLLHVKYNDSTEFKIFDKLFKGYKFTAVFCKGENNPYTIKNNDRLFEAIKKSAEESELYNVDFSFDISFTCMDAISGNRSKYIAKYQEINLPATKTLIKDDKNKRVQFPVKIYYGKLQFPFILYNTEKAKRYVSYKTKDKIFQSTYNIVIVPISMTDDSLTYDFFLNYSKLNLGDGIPRWTPIKKRITISRNLKVGNIVLPHEDWSVNFTRKGEYYDINGYADVERFVENLLYIKYSVSRDGDK